LHRSDESGLREVLVPLVQKPSAHTKNYRSEVRNKFFKYPPGLKIVRWPKTALRAVLRAAPQCVDRNAVRTDPKAVCGESQCVNTAEGMALRSTPKFLRPWHAVRPIDIPVRGKSHAGEGVNHCNDVIASLA